MLEKRKVASLKKERFQRTFQQIVLFSNLLLPTLKNSTSIWSIKNVHISNKFWPFKIKTRTHQGNYNANFTLFTIFCHDLFSLHVFPICFSTMFKLFHNFALTLSHFTSHSFGKLYSLLFYFPRFLFGILITWTSFTDAQATMPQQGHFGLSQNNSENNKRKRKRNSVNSSTPALASTDGQLPIYQNVRFRICQCLQMPEANARRK